MHDTITITGNVATDPTLSRTGGGIPVVNFRVASARRRFDNGSQTWVDAGTNWYSVAAFRQLGEHAKASLRTGDSVIVTGRLKIRDWEANGKHGTSVDIDAEALGHDLRWGTSAFLSASRAASAERGRSNSDPGSRDGGRTSADERDPDELGHGEDLDLSWATGPGVQGGAETIVSD